MFAYFGMVSLSLLLPTSVIYPFHPCLSSVRCFSIRIVLPAAFLFADSFLFHTSCSHHPPYLSCFSSFGRHLPHGSALKKQRKSKNKLVTAVAVDKTDLKHSLFFPYCFPLSTSFSLFALSWPSSSHNILFSLNSPSPALSTFQFRVTSSKGGRDTQPCPHFQSGLGVGQVCWGKSVARGSKTYASKVTLAWWLTSVTDSECPALLGFYVGRGQPGSNCLRWCWSFTTSLMSFCCTILLYTIVFWLTELVFLLYSGF